MTATLYTKGRTNYRTIVLTPDRIKKLHLYGQRKLSRYYEKPGLTPGTSFRYVEVANDYIFADIVGTKNK